MGLGASGRDVRFFSRRFCARKPSIGLRMADDWSSGTGGRTTGSNIRQWFVRSGLGVGFAELNKGNNSEAHKKPRNHRIDFPLRAFNDPNLDVVSAILNH